MTRGMPKEDGLGDLAQHLACAQHQSHLSNHHSSSLPTTPNLRARTISFGARSPSLERQRQNASPKSTHSDNHNSFRSRSKAPSVAGCKYETGMAFSRRRIPYSIGGDQLERPKTMPKKYLNPQEEEKLSGDMRELYDRILPSEESNRRRAEFVHKLERILNQQWRDSDIRVHVFGSSGNLLCTSDSDVDICITTPLKALEQVCLLANALAEHGMERVVCVSHAKVPIVKFWDPALQLACDMNVNNTLALENTRMIKTYVEIDERVRPLAMIIKQWTKRRILNDAALGGTLSSYTWICLILNFMQTRNPPILPSLHKKPHQRKIGPDGHPASFDDDLERLRGYGRENRESLGELLFHFYRRYAYDLDFDKNVISVREGKLISKEAKKWHLMLNNRLCVEEPFNTERNLGNTADDTSFRGIHLEIRRAFDLVKDAKLDECLQEYTFPASEEKRYEKPAPRPPPVLARSRSQSQSSRGNRGGHGNRGGGRHGPSTQRNSGRRASSAAALSKFTAPQIGFHSLPGRDYPTRDSHLQAQYEQLQLHHELFNKFQFLQAQEHELRLLQAQTELHAQMQTQGSSNGPSSQHQQRSSSDQHQRIPMSNQMPLTAPLHSGQFMHPFQYPQVPGTPQHSVHTQPSSPSMKTVQPDLRRSFHRSSAADNTSASHRSHSQPARPVPPPGVVGQIAPPIAMNSQAFLQYQQHLRQQQIHEAMEIAQGRQRSIEMPMHQDPRRMPLDNNYEESVQKEYVGYWVNDSPPPRVYREDQLIPRLPAYQDLHSRVRGVPHNFSRLRNSSRSPSPSPAMPFRDRSFSIRSASSAPSQPAQLRYERGHPPFPAPQIPGPITVNGSDGWTMTDYSMVPQVSSRTATLSQGTSGSDERTYETPATVETEIPSGRGFDDGFALDEPQHYLKSQPMPEALRVVSHNQNAHLNSGMRQADLQMGEMLTSPNTMQRSERPSKPAGGLGIQFGEHEIRHTSLKVESVLSPKPARATVAVPNTVPKSDQQPLIPPPVLSPVREVRTPSPTAKRREDIQFHAQSSNGGRPMKLDLRIPAFADLKRAKREKQNGTLDQKPNGVSHSQLGETTKWSQLPQLSTVSHPAQGHRANQILDESPLGTVQHAQTNGWQQQSGKKGKKGRSRPSSGQFPGEQMPMNEAERKGG